MDSITNTSEICGADETTSGVRVGLEGVGMKVGGVGVGGVGVEEVGGIIH